MTADIESIIESVRSLIAQNISDSMTEVRLAFRKNAIANPIRKTYIILNPVKVTVTPYHGEDFLQTKKTLYKLSINIHRAENSDPKYLLRIFTEILSVFDETGIFSVEEFSCGEIASDSDSNSIYLPCFVDFSVIS